MCAINGIFKFHSSSNLDLNLIKKMNFLSLHRGPDSSNFLLNKNYAFGSNRLSIVDSENKLANQPFEKNDIIITFNGEIYNYRRLKEELISKYGSKFITECDTEVLLELYKFYGINFLEKVEGMFAISIYDKNKKQLFLIRDRFGEKPLFYYHDNKNLIFSSELKSIYFSFKKLFSINLSSLENYLSLNYILENNSIIKDIKKVQPGNYIKFDLTGNFKTIDYWRLNEFVSKKNFDTKNILRDELSEIILDCAKYDKKVGVFLSGGIDSSYIASDLKKNNINLSSSTYKFSNSNFDESKDAKFISDFLQINNFQISDNENRNAEDITKIIYHLDEPMSDTSIIPFYQLCKNSKHLSRVFLSGDGGDEVFLGYDTYIADLLNSKIYFLKPLLKILKTFYSSKNEQDKKISNFEKVNRFISNMNRNKIDAHYGWRSIFNSTEISNIVKSNYSKIINNHNSIKTFRELYKNIDSNDNLNKLSYIDIKTWLPSDILVKTDRLSMANSIEVRSPFLNHKIIEKILSLNSRFKIDLFNKKKIIKKLSNNMLPNNIINKKKSGFNSPVAKLLNNNLSEMTKDYFNSQNSKKLFNNEILSSLLYEHNNNKKDNHLKLFNILVLLIYFDQYEINL